MKRTKPALGIAFKRTFSICRMVNVDRRSPKLHSSLNIMVDELNGWTWEIALDFVNGRLHVIIPQTCRRRPSTLEHVSAVMSEIMALSPEKMLLVCMERLDARQVQDAILTEVDLHDSHDREGKAEIQSMVRDELRKCVLEPEL